MTLISRLWLGAGFVFVAIGTVGIVLPLLPTVVFYIAAAACFARGSPKLEERLINHTRFGPAIRAWRERRAIPRKAKVWAVIVMSASFAFTAWKGVLPLWGLVALGVFLAGMATWLIARPEP